MGLLDRLGTDRTALARELLGAMLRQVLLDGTFHADLYPGNVLVLGDGTALERGMLSTNVRLFADQRDVRVVAGLVNRAVLAFLGVGFGIVSVVLLGTRGGSALTPTTSAVQPFGYLGLVFGVVVVLRVVIATVRDRTG